MCAAALSLFANAAADAAEPARPSLIVLDVAAKGATALEAGAAGTGIVRGLRQLDVFQILSADDIRELLAMERSRQIIGVSGEGSAPVDLSDTFGARHVVT